MDLLWLGPCHLILEHKLMLLMSLSQAMQLVHLTAFHPYDSLNFGVATPADIVAHKEFIDKLVVAFCSQADLVGEVHGGVEEFLVG